MLRKLYDWTLAKAAHPKAEWWLALFAFVEASFFPIPPHPLLGLMCLAEPKKALRFALIATLASVAGGMLGYAIGYFLYESVGLWLMHLYGYGDKIEAFRQAYVEWGTWIILLKGLTPIPYKIVTIASGFTGYPFIPFVLLSIVARGMRFFLVAFLIHRYGPQARAIIEERLGFWVTISSVTLLGGIIAAVYLF